jgi:CRISPR-associated endonuclease Csn1
MKKNILGLDLGTNSIGWALIEKNEEENNDKIIGAGCRIIPMSQDVLGKFDSGVSISQTAERTNFRGIRRLRERHLLRRERLHRVLNILGFLPSHYTSEIDFKKRLGQFIPEAEPKMAYIPNKEKNKSDFIFQNAFNEMLADFAQFQPQLLENGKKLPYDWTIYYLRKKALTEKIEKEELAWLLLHFNQKRGYYQLRGEDEETLQNKLVEFYSLKVIDVTDSGDKKGKDEIWYNVHLENGWIYRRTSKIPLDWVGKTKEFIVTSDLNEDGTIKKDKDGKEKRSFRAPAEDDWTLVKKKTEYDIEKSNKTVGAYIYETLLSNPNQKIRGKLVRTIERKYYKQELKHILETQYKYHTELQDKNLYKACIVELYELNDGHRNILENKNITHLFIEDIIFYQRPLKSKKSLISDCKFESRCYIRNGNIENQPVKCIAKSHPLFQEFRLIKFIQNLRIIEKTKEINGRLETDVDVTKEFIKSTEDWVNLYDWLNDRKEIDQKAFLKYPPFGIKKYIDNYRWNYVEDKTYPCNETRSLILNRLAKINEIPANFLNDQYLEELWHILYSVEDKNDIAKALKTFAQKKKLNDDFIEQFKSFPPFRKDYGSYSAKAIKKLLPLMRIGSKWTENNFHSETRERIDKIISGEYDHTIRDRVRDKAIELKEINHFQGLPEWLASYIVYDRHSEDGNALKWKTPIEIELLEQHSLRNPIVEQVINETLKVVRDIWKHYGKGVEYFFHEIHIELGREMKNTKADREKMSKQITENENTNLRIKALLLEMLNDKEFENVRPYSPMQQEILKIYEEGALNSEEGRIEDEILKISKQSQPTKSDLTRYKLWLQQKYRSPYTGSIIPLNKLFTPAYEIEHIIPQSRYFDDSFSNKVICEAVVNGQNYKANQTGYEFIKNFSGQIVNELSFGAHTVKIFTTEEYEFFIKENYSRTRGKMKKLLMEEIPEDFIQRQLNDSRYISKVVKNLMSNIVREEGEQEVISKNVISGNGTITSVLKQDWGLNDIWNEIISPRFERLNDLTKSQNFGEWTNKEGKKVFQINVPFELQKGFNKKRIDHRHHALDAIIIACTTRDHINFLNNASALGKNSKEEKERKRYDLRNKLCFKKFNDTTNQQYRWAFKKPWQSFTQETKETLYTIIVNFKQNTRIINKTNNYYQKLAKDINGKMIRIKHKQEMGNNWAIRQALHTPMPYGKKYCQFDILKICENIGKRDFIINPEIRKSVNSVFETNNNKIKQTETHLRNNPILGIDGSPILHTAYKIRTEKFRKRQPIAKLSNRGQGGIKTYEDALKFINKISDVELLANLTDHLNENNKDIDSAFSVDGIENFNAKRRIPVFKLPIAESGDKRFSLGIKSGTRHKWMEAAEGTNLFFGIYIDHNENRSYESIPLITIIERQKQYLSTVPETNEKGHRLLMYLSPNDLVYIPNEEEIDNKNNINIEKNKKSKVNRIYKFVSCTGNEAHFVPHYYSKEITKNEMGSNNKSQNSLDGIQIKMKCQKIKIDRLGNIVTIK